MTTLASIFALVAVAEAGFIVARTPAVDAFLFALRRRWANRAEPDQVVDLREPLPGSWRAGDLADAGRPPVGDIPVEDADRQLRAALVAAHPATVEDIARRTK